MLGSDRQPRRWTPTEDQTLRERVDAQGGGKDWCQIALALPGRTNKDCRKRWHNSIAEGLRKGQWSKSEDQQLTQGVHRYGWQWTKVATCVSSRSADQCAKRWQQSLDPRLDRTEWREQEDAALLAAVERLGRRWKDIQEQYLPHRSKNCVKNRYSVLIRRNATQSIPYDDSLGSSSSGPGTPQQMEADLSLGPTPIPYVNNTTQEVYTQNRCFQMSSDEMSWAWSGLSNPYASSTSSHLGAFSTGPWSTYPNVHPSQVPSNSQNHWNQMQTTMDLQHPMHYPTTSDAQMYDYRYTTHQRPSLSSRNPYTTSTTRPPNPNAPSSRLSSSSIYSGGY